MEEQLYGIIAAAGMGKRAQLGYNKNYAPLGMCQSWFATFMR